MKRMIESIFNLFYPESDNIKESDKMQVWQMALILIFFGLMLLILYLYG